MVNASAFDDSPPPVTETYPVPEVASSEAEMVAVSRLALTNAVGCAIPFQFTAAPETNPLPLTVSVNVMLPAPAANGLSPLTMGTPAGFELTLRFTGFDGMP